MDPPTSTTSSISEVFFPESDKAFSTGFKVYLNKSEFNSSNLALDKVSSKSNSSYKFSISITYS